MFVQVLTRRAAYSREKGVRRTYVQHLLLEHGATITDLVYREGGSVLVCGSVSQVEKVACFDRSIFKGFLIVISAGTIKGSIQ